ncbi:anti-sigma factor [Agromyces aerolatus]|uniref:anti-sigma factor n=1 Tax=Agromyces sp. LY-1074 TaxID=3074080 RepID=UPI00285EBF3C|nr:MULTISPECIES: anti-sigma factor [unclassified Agromyces]MDR5698636.1 anti-sigma factor [Agromyces sp. LY-1074]MDR5704930.1 anti-sigma factor [Agromyces sp. LY-1358]
MSRADDSERSPRIDADLFDLAPAYALGALDEFERARFERALAASPELQAEVAAFRTTAADLAEGIAPVEPPPSLKADLFARLDDVEQERPAPERPAESDPAAGGPAAVVPAAGEPTAGVPAPGAPTDGGGPIDRETADGGAVDELAARRARRRLAIAISSAAAVVLLIAGVVFGVNWPGPNGWGAQRELALLAEASDSQTATIEAADGGEVTLVWSEEQGLSAIRAAGLPDVGGERTYELWYIDEDGPVSAGTFDVRGDADAWRILEGEFDPGTAVGITIEPAGGSEQPTTEPIAVLQT